MRSVVAWVKTSVAALLLLLCGCGGGSTTPSGTDWQYVALGDSLAAGFTASRGYVPRYAAYTETENGVTVRVQNMGRAGWTSSDLRDALRNDNAMRNAVTSADVVTWNIGGNDLLHAYRLFLEGNCGGADNQDCFRSGVAEFKANWDAIVSEIVSLAQPGSTVIRTMDIYNPFIAEQMQLGSVNATVPYLEEVDAYIRTSAEQNGIPVARVYEAFNGASGREDPVSKGLISQDGFHANDAGHDMMAILLRDLGYAPKN